MQITIQQVSDVKVGQYGPSCKIHGADSATYYVNEDATPLIGKTVEAEITEKTAKSGNKYKLAKIVKVIETAAARPTQNGNGNHPITWDSYRTIAEAAHELARKLEPDGTTETADRDGGVIQTKVDRAPARIGFVNNVMRDYASGKIFVPEEEDDIPPF